MVFPLIILISRLDNDRRGQRMREEMTGDAMEGRALMLYDGLCGVCNSAVQWVIKRDHADRFRFAPQQSALAAAILSRNGIVREARIESNSVYMVLDAGSKQERLLTQSDVTVNLLLLLGGRWRILGVMLRAVPLFLRNAAYRVFARNRYRLAGQYEVCPVPSEAQQLKFVG
jgi:predicted DCC family thiol-disulfide oxidoreductase YuxK